jgi:catechol-2,3-dioxygenase
VEVLRRREKKAEPESGLSISGVLESCLYAEDLESAERFYSEILRLAIHSPSNGRDVFLRCGSTMLLIFNPRRSDKPHSSVPRHGASGASHVAFSIHREDYGLWKDHLISNAVVIEKEINWPTGGQSLYFRDPAGNSVELATPQVWESTGPRES